MEAEKDFVTLIIRFLHVKQPLLRGTPTIFGGGLKSLRVRAWSLGLELLIGISIRPLVGNSNESVGDAGC